MKVNKTMKTKTIISLTYRDSTKFINFVLISIVEEDDYKNSLYKNFFGQKYDSAHNMFKKDLFSFQENIDSEQGNLECKYKLNSLFKL